jgi:hypothetical protein
MEVYIPWTNIFMCPLQEHNKNKNYQTIIIIIIIIV